jgi:hypothetical protein
MRHGLFHCVVVAVGVCVSGCVHHAQVATAAPRAFDRRIIVNQHALTLRVSRGTAEHRAELLVYATGDGGWRGMDRDVYRQLESWGYAAIGFSAPEYLDHLPGADGTTTPARLASDFATIIEQGREAIDDTASRRSVLVGVSRGADLAVVAAGQADLQPQLGGVVVMGLTREEEYVHGRHDPVGALELYAYLPSLGDVPLSVIQSTRDKYLPADEARVLFGQDMPYRTFHAIEARNHSFAGARPLLYSTLRASLAWVTRLDRKTTG